MEVSILIAGSGGHGVQSAGKTIVQGAILAGYNASSLPQYGIEKRGGFSACYLVISDDVIGNVKKTKSDVVIVIDERAYKLFGGSVKENGTLVWDVGIGSVSVDCCAVSAPILETAVALGDMRSISTIVTGLIMGIPGVLPNADEVRTYIIEKYAKKPTVAEMNAKAYDSGLAMGAEVAFGVSEV
jgi:Pyruvate/2-oxoacid:ferredoxin oxidoreductase gamma subunit